MTTTRDIVARYLKKKKKKKNLFNNLLWMHNYSTHILFLSY
jgi:hypothetical protein